MHLKEGGVFNKPYKKAFLGGTFDRFHTGHESLISTAVKLADYIFVGVVSHDLGYKLFAKKNLKETIQSFEIRSLGVSDFLSRISSNYEVGVLDDPWGPAPIDETQQGVLVVSKETEKSAVIINRMRAERGNKKLDVVVIPWMRDEGGVPYSSTRMRESEK